MNKGAHEQIKSKMPEIDCEHYCLPDEPAIGRLLTRREYTKVYAKCAMLRDCDPVVIESRAHLPMTAPKMFPFRQSLFDRLAGMKGE